jgi:serine/threonine protein kinase
MNKFYNLKQLDTPTNGDNEIFTARYKKNDKKVLIKKCNKKKCSKKQLEREIEFMLALNYKYIIKCYEIFEENHFTYFVLEFAPKGNIYSKKYKWTEKNVKNIIIQIISAIQYCHKKGILHRDIKPENVVMFDDGSVKLIDFGWACYYDTNKPPREKSGTAIYNAPEMIKHEPYDFKADIWQLGILIYDLLARRIPFEDESEESNSGVESSVESRSNISESEESENSDDINEDKKIEARILECQVEFPSNFSSNLIDLLKHIITPLPEDRYSLDQILRHKWFRTS